MYKYTAKFTALCPNDKTIVDKYKCKIYSTKIIMVEDISKYLDDQKNNAIYQEDLTDKILKMFKCEKVVLVGMHLGVKIKSVVK